ncbi:MAG: hypothetical protein R3B13_31805 [Polyangiaceae bacterium]
MRTWVLALVPLACVTLGCSEEAEPPRPTFTAVTFNTGTTKSIGAQNPDDGYGPAEASASDQYYGDGLAWRAVVEDTRAFLAEVAPDVIGFQEIFFSGDCTTVPADARAGFVCETWQPGDETVAQVILGAGYQVACHSGKDDKCVGVKKSFAILDGCDADLCMDFLDGAEVPGCGSGSRIGRAALLRPNGERWTLVNVHGSSGLTLEDTACRTKQFALVFEDMDGQPAANGEKNLILGDFNTDPGRADTFDPSAQKVLEHAGPGKSFHFVTDVGTDAVPTYAGNFNIDHVISDAFEGSCWAAGVDPGRPAVSDVAYFDHKPIVCSLRR